MKPTLHLVKLEKVPIFQQLRMEEALLRNDNRNWCLINTGSSPAIVMGISGQPHLLINQEKLQKEPIPIIKRFSGGGTVVVDENTLFVTFICQSTAIETQPFPKHLMEWSAEIYRPLFKSHPFDLKENDYVIGERKWGGNAQSIVKGRWLHHSSLLWDYCPERMNYLLFPPKTPAYRNKRNHSDFLCHLKYFWETKEHFCQKVIEQIHVKFQVEETSMKFVEKLCEIPHRQSTKIIKADREAIDSVFH